MRDNADIVVVGAGFAGLRAATLLAEDGMDVLVLEARDRVGGKVESQLDARGDLVDTGGQFVCDDMTHVLELVRSQGKQLVRVGDDRPGLAFFGDAPTPDPAALDRAESEAWAVSEMLGDEPPPPMSPEQSVDEWFASRIDDPLVLRAARAAVGSMMCMPLDRIPVTSMAYEARRTPLTVGELQYIVAETIHQVAVDLAASLPRPLLLSSPVDAAQVLLAIPPAAVPHLTFDPPLPDLLADTLASYRAGDVFKYLVRYDRPFWRREDVSSRRRFLHPAGMYCCEAAPQEDRPTIVVFIGGAGAYELQQCTPEERRRVVLDRLVEGYGPEAAHPISFLERDWRPDRWGAGGYCNEMVDVRHAPPHADAIGVLRAGAPGITFASTDLAEAFPGYIEGALRAGRAAARLVSGSDRAPSA